MIKLPASISANKFISGSTRGKVAFLTALLWAFPSLVDANQTQPLEPLVPVARHLAQPVLEKELREAEKETLSQLARSKNVPAEGKLEITLHCLTNPWDGFTSLEQTCWQLAMDTSPLPVWFRNSIPLLHSLTDVYPYDGSITDFPSFDQWPGEDPLRYLVAVVETAEDYRNKAIKALTEEQQNLIIKHARDVVNHFDVHLFSPDREWLARYQVPPYANAIFDGIQKTIVERDLEVLRLANELMDWSAMRNAAIVLSHLGDHHWQDSLKDAMRNRDPIADNPQGVQGPVLWKKETGAGLILIGGFEPNRYQMNRAPVAIIDLGGDSVWMGTAGASDPGGAGNSVVVSLAGNDQFLTGNLGLATGILGVGMVINRAGDDIYRARNGGAGVGIGGIGVLIDEAGQDHYYGGRFSLGAAFVGLGLLLADGEGGMHEGKIFSLGFGGPGGVGLVYRRGGDHNYTAGRTVASGYNPLDRSIDDRRFEYTGFSLGSGSGRRIFSPHSEENRKSIAGGVGIFIGGSGDNTYEAGNFSLGSGYFFGTGAFLEMGGSNQYKAARYGLAAGAHHGVSLFIDYEGDDTYKSFGPTYNGGCAWDYSASLFIEGGGNDTYDFSVSSGLGRADHHSWGVAIELSGDDTYKVPAGMGASSNRSVAAFMDFGGNDDYSAALPRAQERPNNNKLIGREHSLFLDQE